MRTLTLDLTAPASGDFKVVGRLNCELRGFVEAALVRVGREPSSFEWNDLWLRSGEQVHLPRDAERLRGGVSEICTCDAAEFQRWIGFDATIRNWTEWAAAARPAGTPDAQSWVLSSSQAQGRQAGATDVVPNSWGGTAFNTRPEHCSVPFRAQLIVASRVVLEPFAELRITGLPAVVIIEELIFEGGQLFLNTASHFTIGLATGSDAA